MFRRGSIWFFLLTFFEALAFFAGPGPDALVLGAEFGERPLDAGKKAQIDALIQQLGSSSSKEREEAGARLLQIGAESAESLREACLNPDFTIAEGARYYLRFLNQGLIRSDDPMEVRKILAQYSQVPIANRSLPIYDLSQLPPEKSLRPLLRLVVHENAPIAARTAALGVFWTLPFRSPVPAWTLPFPEAKPFPVAETWERENADANARRQNWLLQIWEYLGTVSANSVGKSFLQELLDLERELSLAQALPESDSEERRLRKESALARFTQLQERFQEEFRLTSTPTEMQFLKEFTHWGAELFLQAGFKEDAEAIMAQHWSRNPCAMRLCVFENGEPRIVCIVLRFHLIQILAVRGCWDWARQEIRLLAEELQPSEKTQIFPYIVQLQRSIGAFSDALTMSKEMRRYFFLSENAGDDLAQEELLAGQIVYLEALEFCVQGRYPEVKTLLQKRLGEVKNVDVDTLILARKTAVFTEDSVWLAELEKLAAEELDRVEKKIQVLTFDAEAFELESDKKERANRLNQFAWLAANTNQRLDEALRYAQDALNLLPESGGITDTLAMVYFARGEYEMAVETQKKAILLEPLELEIRQNFERFRVYLPSSEALNVKPEGE